MLSAKLVVVGGDAKSKEVELRLPCVIGRGRDSTLTLPHPLVSRQHTEITERDGRLFVKDLGSLNGTFLNNKRLEKEEELKPDQLLTLGNVTFRAVYDVGNDDELFDQEVNEALELQPTIGDTHSSERSNDAERLSDAERLRLSEKETVYDDEKSSNASDTDKSIIDNETAPEDRSDEKNNQGRPAISKSSNIFVEIDGVETVVPVSSIDGLPEAPSSMSFASGVDLSADTHPEAQPVDSMDLELGSQVQKKPADDSGLDSFINKLPR